MKTKRPVKPATHKLPANRRFAAARGYAAYGRYKVNGIHVIECLRCGVREPVKTRTQKQNFRLKHNATCHMRHIAPDELPTGRGGRDNG